MFILDFRFLLKMNSDVFCYVQIECLRRPCVKKVCEEEVTKSFAKCRRVIFVILKQIRE